MEHLFSEICRAAGGAPRRSSAKYLHKRGAGQREFLDPLIRTGGEIPRTPPLTSAEPLVYCARMAAHNCERVAPSEPQGRRPNGECTFLYSESLFSRASCFLFSFRDPRRGDIVCRSADQTQAERFLRQNFFYLFLIHPHRVRTQVC